MGRLGRRSPRRPGEGAIPAGRRGSTLVPTLPGWHKGGPRATSRRKRSARPASPRPGTRLVPPDPSPTIGADMDSAVIEVEGLRKEYRRLRGGRTLAVDGLDMAVPHGGVFGFL